MPAATTPSDSLCMSLHPIDNMFKTCLPLLCSRIYPDAHVDLVSLGAPVNPRLVGDSNPWQHGRWAGVLASVILRFKNRHTPLPYRKIDIIPCYDTGK